MISTEKEKDKLNTRLKLKAKFFRQKIGKAIKDYGMIKNNDKVLVCLSGGKDSFVLFKALSDKSLMHALNYRLMACHIESDLIMDAGKSRLNNVKELLEASGVSYAIGMSRPKEKNKRDKISCFWCSWNRRKAIFEIAHKNNCNKIALGHHMDDVVETTLLNMFFNGEISTMNPNQEMFDGKFAIIRPLCYVKESEIDSYAVALNHKKTDACCSNMNTSKRKYIKRIIADISRVHPKIKTNIFGSTARIRKDYLAKRAN